MSASIPIARPALRRRFLTAHRWLSLGAAVFWLLQALTGILIVFHWEITDATISSLHRPTDLVAIERSIDTLAPHGGNITVKSVWTTAGAADRFNVILEDDHGNGSSVRIAGDGTVLDKPPADEQSVLGFLVGFHHDLLGSWGSWIVSISGILLFSNLLLGLFAAWPKRGTWKLALKPATRGPAAARLYSWHRAVGLWAAIPALVIVGTGTLLKFEGGTANLIGAEAVSMARNPPVGDPVGFAAAVTAATHAIPGSTLTAINWPTGDDATYALRLLAPGDLRRAYGDNRVLVDANTGQVRGIFPIAEAPAARAFMSSLFPLHTGEAGGLIGRILSIAIGLWLITMIVAGTLLWFKRRKRRRTE